MPKGIPNPAPAPLKIPEFSDIKLRPSKSPERYTARRVYWLVLTYSKKIHADPTSVKIEDYLKLLDRWEVIQKNLNKKAGRRADAGVDTREVAEDRVEDISTILG